MKKSKSAKPIKPVVETVWYLVRDEEGVGVFEGDCPDKPGFCNVRISAHIHTSTDIFSDFDVKNLVCKIPVSNLRHVSNAYVYGWIQMQKNLKQYRAQLKGKKTA